MLHDHDLKGALSNYIGSTLFITESEDTEIGGEALPDHYDWGGPIPRVGEVVYVTKHNHINGYTRVLRVVDVSYSSIVRDLDTQIYIRCDIRTIQVKYHSIKT